MKTDLDAQFRDIAEALVADVPDVPNWPPARTESAMTGQLPRRPLALMVAASAVIAGTAGLVAVRLGGSSSPAGVGGLGPTTGHTVPATTPSEIEYTVAPGDFLSAIAASHCVTMEEIANFNNWADGVNHLLFPGNAIRIPPGACSPSASAQTTIAPASTVALIEQTYEVVVGDSLFEIASRFGLTAEALAEFNDWPDGVGHALFVGDVILVPPGASTAGSATLPPSLILLGPPLLARRRRPHPGRPAPPRANWAAKPGTCEPEAAQKAE